MSAVDGGLVSMGIGVVFIPLIALAASIFWIWVFVDCAVNEPSGSTDKIVWIPRTAAAAEDAGVRRIVHVSITNPSLESPQQLGGRER